MYYYIIHMLHKKVKRLKLRFAPKLSDCELCPVIGVQTSVIVRTLHGSMVTREQCSTRINIYTVQYTYISTVQYVHSTYIRVAYYSGSNVRDFVGQRFIVHVKGLCREVT